MSDAFATRATLPTLLGVLVLILGLYAFFSGPDGESAEGSSPDTVQTTPVAQVESAVTLTNAATGETRTVSVQTPDTPNAVLKATLAELRAWLLETDLWVEPLGAPTVFRLDERAVLDFPLEGSPDISVGREQQLLTSIEQTLAQQGVSEVVILANGESRPVFLEHLAVEGRLE